MMFNRTDDLGERIRGIRKARSLTIKDVSEKAGVTIGLISQIERNIANPSLRSLQKIASALEVPVASFFTPRPRVLGPVIRVAEQQELPCDQSGISYYRLTPDDSSSLGMVLAEYEPGTKSGEFLFLHAGTECCYVLQGTMKIILGHREYILETGDSVTIKGLTPHFIENPGAETLKTLWALAPFPC